MQEILLGLCNILSNCLNWIIVGLAIVELCILIRSGAILSKLKGRIDTFFSGKSVAIGVKKLQRGQIISEHISETTMDMSQLDSFLQDYQKKLGTYNTFVSIIQIFPLLGILGTVAGLYVAMNENMNGNQALYDGVRFALSSTVLGIIFAVFFKIVDIFLVNIINYIDDGIDRYKLNYRTENEKVQNGQTGHTVHP